jgi:hypothetical protein
MDQGERSPDISSDRATVVAVDTREQVARSLGVRRLLSLSGLLIGIGLSLELLWGDPVVVVLGERVVSSGSVGSLVAFVGMLLLLGTGISAAVRSAR